MATKKVYGTDWNATLQLVLNALYDDDSLLSIATEIYLHTYLTSPNTYDDVEISVDVLNLVKAIAPATTLTPEELTYVLDECNIILGEDEGEKS